MISDVSTNTMVSGDRHTKELLPPVQSTAGVFPIDGLGLDTIITCALVHEVVLFLFGEPPAGGDVFGKHNQRSDTDDESEQTFHQEQNSPRLELVAVNVRYGECENAVDETAKRSHSEPESDTHAQGLSGVESRQVHLNKRGEACLAETDQESAGHGTGKVGHGGETSGGDTPSDGAECEDEAHACSFTQKGEWDH